jgi:hypothetical protein
MFSRPLLDPSAMLPTPGLEAGGGMEDQDDCFGAVVVGAGAAPTSPEKRHALGMVQSDAQRWRGGRSNAARDGLQPGTGGEVGDAERSDGG